MSKTKKTTKKKEARKDFHHIGTPSIVEVDYHTGNMEYMIVMQANNSNTHYLGEHVQVGDSLFLSLSEQDAEQLCESLISAVSDRLKQKLERYNQQKKIYWMSELEGNEKDWKDSNWNSFNQK